MDSLLREVSADVRAEQLSKFWARHRNHLFLLIAAIVLGTTGYAIWQHQREVRGGNTLMHFTAAQAMLEQGKPAEAAKGFAAIAAETSGDAQKIAQLWQARALVAAGSRDEAITLLTQTSATSGLWGDIACLRLAGLNAPASTTCLNTATASPLSSLRVQWAAAEAWQAGDHARALTLLTQLIDNKDTPAPVRENAQRWRAMLSAKKANTP